MSAFLRECALEKAAQPVVKFEQGPAEPPYWYQQPSMSTITINANPQTWA